MTLDYDQSLRMARHMKEQNLEIVKAIEGVVQAQHGVVALKFSDECREMGIEILDEPFDPNVRVYPG